MKHAIAAVMILVLSACGRPAAPPPTATSSSPAQTVTQATFEPVYRSAKTIQGATKSGVTYMKFGELMQGLSTEIAIAKDHQLNEPDKRLLELYAEGFGHYQVSAKLWEMKNQAHGDLWKGEIPIEIEGKADSAMMDVVEKYKLPLAERKVQYTGAKYRAAPGDSIQRVWAAADVTLQKATDLYYGR